MHNTRFLSQEYHTFLHFPLKVLALNKSTLLTIAKFTSIAMANCILVGNCSSNSDSSVKQTNKQTNKKEKQALLENIKGEWKYVHKNYNCTEK